MMLHLTLLRISPKTSCVKPTKAYPASVCVRGHKKAIILRDALPDRSSRIPSSDRGEARGPRIPSPPESRGKGFSGARLQRVVAARVGCETQSERPRRSFSDCFEGSYATVPRREQIITARGERAKGGGYRRKDEPATVAGWSGFEGSSMCRQGESPIGD